MQEGGDELMAANQIWDSDAELAGAGLMPFFYSSKCLSPFTQGSRHKMRGSPEEIFNNVTRFWWVVRLTIDEAVS